jgi:hypothetical protein
MIIDACTEKITQIPHHKGRREYILFPKGLKEPSPVSLFEGGDILLA